MPSNPTDHDRSALEYRVESAGQVKDIAKPLEYLGIQDFTYVKVFYDGRILDLCSNANWMKFYHQSDLGYGKATTQAITQAEPNKLSTFLWPSLNEEVVYDALYEHAMCHGLTLFQKNEDSVTLWAFSTTKDNPHIADVYINNFDKLKRFVLYFTDTASHLIDTSNPSKLFIPDFNENTLQNENTRLTKTLDRYFHQTQLSKYPITHKNDTVYLTRRQIDCLTPLALGRTLKEIALDLSLSPRTVEHYLENIRHKLRCQNRSQLIDVFRENVLEKSVA